MPDDGRVKIPRGPNAERRASTRAKIMEAAVRCLADFGYAATSTPLVAQLAKVSRGSLLHQFPTKVDLILAVAEHAARVQGEYIVQELSAHPPGRARFIEGVDVLWKALRRPEAIAAMEIRLAARSDAELAQRYPDFVAGLEEGRHRARRRMAESMGVPERAAEIDVIVDLSLAALRGLAMETLYIGRSTVDAEKVVALLKDQRRRLADEIGLP